MLSFSLQDDIIYLFTIKFLGVKCDHDFWKHSFSFKAFTEPQEGTIPLSVGWAGDDEQHRSRVSKVNINIMFQK